MTRIELNDAEIGLIEDALGDYRKGLDREPSRREDVTLVSAIDNLLEKLRSEAVVEKPEDEATR